jgi:hypothetical protein
MVFLNVKKKKVGGREMFVTAVTSISEEWEGLSVS